MAAYEAARSDDPASQARCSSCGADLHPSVQRCGQCDQPVSDAYWATCVVTLRRGYVSGAFVATLEGNEPEEIGRSPQFRLRKGDTARPETTEVSSCLNALEAQLESSGWERIEDEGSDGKSPRFRRRVIPLHQRISAYVSEPDPEAFPWEPLGKDDSAPIGAQADAA